MDNNALIRDPLFQLNLLIWMTKEQPTSGYVVRPWYFEQGFRLIYIEQPFAMPPSSIAAILGSGLEISQAPEPELIVGRMTDRLALYFEAKGESFGTNSSTAKQARGHLLAVGSAFADVMTPLESCVLCYVLPEERRNSMVTCLGELSMEMGELGLPIGETSVHGLSAQESNLWYTWDEGFRATVGVDDNGIVVMSGLAADTDPTPLFLVYSVEDYPDPRRQDLLRKALIDQVHAVLLCELNALPIAEPLQRSAESLLVELTDGVFQYIGKRRQKQMRDFVRDSVFRRISEHSKGRFEDIVQLEQWQLQISYPTQEKKEAFLAWLEDHRKTNFATRKMSQQTRSLFGVDDEQ